MTRPLRSKLLYLLACVVLGTMVAVVAVLAPFDTRHTLIAAAVILLIPGRIQGFVFRDHYRGRRLLDGGDFESAIRHCEKFLRHVREKPWIKHFIWLAWGMYSWDIEAMTLNNLGAALMSTGRFDGSEDRLKQAISLDPEYHIPHFNLAVLAAVDGNDAQVDQHVRRAEELGYANTSTDRAIREAQLLLARVEGR